MRLTNYEMSLQRSAQTNKMITEELEKETHLSTKLK